MKSLKKIHTILYVADQEVSRVFYEKILMQQPELHVPGMTEFHLMDHFILGLMPEKGIRKILEDHTPDPASGNGIPRCELYFCTDNPDNDFRRAVQAGARAISPVQDRTWGDSVGYVADPDGHIIAFANQIKI